MKNVRMGFLICASFDKILMLSNDGFECVFGPINRAEQDKGKTKKKPDPYIYYDEWCTKELNKISLKKQHETESEIFAKR